MMKYSFIRLWHMLNMTVIGWVPLNGQTRYKLLKMGGVAVEGKSGFVGKNVSFDSIRPDLIHIEDGAYITEGCVIYTHHLNTSNFKTSKAWWRYGDVHIGKNVFIGAHTIICNSISIGEGSIVGAGSIVTKDIPPYEIWGGNPARFIKKRC